MLIFNILDLFHNFRMQMYELKLKSRNKQGTKMYPKRTN